MYLAYTDLGCGPGGLALSVKLCTERNSVKSTKRSLQKNVILKIILIIEMHEIFYCF